MSEEDYEIIEMFQPLVFSWLNVISKGTNESVIDKLLTAKGISNTFDLPSEVSEFLIKEWNKNKKQ